MLKEQIKDCKRIVKINKNDTVILFDVSVYLMDCHITKFDVQLIKPIESRITINDFRLESDELLSEHRGQKKNERSNFVYAYQDVEKIKVNHRYHNKRYYTLSAMKGRQVSKCGIPIVIPNGINTDDCKIEINFVICIKGDIEVRIKYIKLLSTSYKKNTQQTAELRINLGWVDFEKILETDEKYNIDEYVFRTWNIFKRPDEEIEKYDFDEFEKLELIEEHIFPVDVDIKYSLEDCKHKVTINYIDDEIIMLGD